MALPGRRESCYRSLVPSFERGAAPPPSLPDPVQPGFDAFAARSALRSLLVTSIIVALPAFVRTESASYYLTQGGLLLVGATGLLATRRWLGPQGVARGVLVVGWVVAATAAWFSGGAFSPAFHAYSVALTGGAWLALGPRGAIVSTAGAVVVGGLLAAATAAGWTPRPWITHTPWTAWLTTATASAVIAVVQWLELQRLRSANARLHDELARVDAAQRRIADSERRYADIVSTVPGVVFEFEGRPDGRRVFTFVSEGARALFERAPTEVAGDAEILFSHVTDPGDRARLDAAIADASEALRPFEIDGRVRTASGVQKHVRAQALPARLSDGTVRWHGVLTDLTERVKAQRALEASQTALTQSLSMLQAAFESTVDGLLVVDGQGRVVAHNQRFLALWRVPEVIARTRDDGQLLAHVLDQLDDPDAFLAKVRELYARPDAVSFDTLTFRDGRCYERYSQPQVANGEVVGRVWSFRDVTARATEERRRGELERELQQAQTLEALGTLAGGIAHDFNNLLTVILANAEQARLEPDAAGRDTCLDAVHAAGTRAAQLVREIRAFSQPRATDRAVVAVSDVIGSALRLITTTLPKHLTLETSLDPRVTMFAASTQVQQVATNLVLNAAQALGDTPGRVLVTLDEVTADAVPDDTPRPRAARYARLTVSDTGPGIAADVMPRVFDPFFSTRTGAGGSGLGLAVVQGIVRRYHGAVVVESTPGHGATFRVYWPALPPSASVTSPARLGGTDAATPRGRGQHILVVDDEPGIVQIVRTSLTRLGYQVTATTDPQDALARFTAAPDSFDAVLSDLSMPVLSGAALGRRMLDVRPDLPIVLFTGYAAELGPDEVRTAGFRAILHKPMTAAALAEALHRVLPAPAGA